MLTHWNAREARRRRVANRYLAEERREDARQGYWARGVDRGDVLPMLGAAIVLVGWVVFAVVLMASGEDAVAVISLHG
jgi:hypothetical protein